MLSASLYTVAEVTTVGSIGIVFRSLTHDVIAKSSATSVVDKIFKYFVFMISDIKN